MQWDDTHKVLVEFSHIIELQASHDAGAQAVEGSLLFNSNETGVNVMVNWASKGPSNQAAPDSCKSHSASASPSKQRLKQIKEEHDKAKAIKSDNAEVPIHLWDERIVRGVPSTAHIKALQVIRRFTLREYRKRLRRDCSKYLRHTHGPKWF